MTRCPAIVALLLSTACCTALRAAPGTLIHDSIIDPSAHNFPTASYSVATVHGVTFQQDGVTTYKGWQYAAYYQGNAANSTGKVAVARRLLPFGSWETLVLNDYTFSTVDSHNDVVLGICPGDGSIHLSFDHHGNDLNYRCSVPGAVENPTSVAWTPALFGPVIDHLTGTAVMAQVTYPRFIPTPTGKLLFTYRFGGSGGGDEMLYEYDGSSHAWMLVGQYTTRSGSYTGSYASGTDRNAYFDNTIFDANGRLHATWCWRETPNASSNHDLLYAYSDDIGRTWKNQLGATIGVAGSSFISVTSPGLVGWPIPQSRNYINNSAMVTDKQGRIHVVAWNLPDGFPDQAFSTSLTSNARFIHYWRGTDGVWRKNQTDLTGSRAKLAADDDGRLFLIYGDATNIQIAAANPATHPEAVPANSWNNWAPLSLSGALPAGKANTVNIITDTARWEVDRILSVYAQETNISGTGPTPLHLLDYHVSRAAVLPVPPDHSNIPGFSPQLSWTAGLTAVANDIYCGTNQAVVASATITSPEYLGRQTAATRGIGPLLEDTTYYWRVDAVDVGNAIIPGRLWSFTTGNLKPSIANGPATRSYGGRATVTGVLDAVDPALNSADLVLQYGNADGGANPASWEHSINLGSQPAGNVSTIIDGLANGVVFFRFRATTIHGTSWAASSGIIAASDELALWAHSALIEVTGYNGTATLTDFPLLVRLAPATLPGFAFDQMLSPPYGDLRFSTPSGDVILAHEVETWDPAGTASVWVKVPSLSSGTKIRVWWGKTGQASPPAAPTWSAFNGVWHLNETLGIALDSSPNNLAGVNNAVTAAGSGIIPGAAFFNGTSANVAITNAPALNPELITVEAWVKTSNSGLISIFSKDRSSGGRVWQFRLNAGKPEFIVFNALSNALVASPDEVNDNGFHHLCGTWDGTNVQIHVDGSLKGTTACSGTLKTNQPNNAFIGRGENTSPAYFNGTIDEVRLSPVARPADWIRASWDNQKPAAAFITTGPAAVPDLDGDHLPDAWEMAHFHSTHGMLTDPDFDGLMNLLEFALGTDPNSGSDQPALQFVAAPLSFPAEFIYPQLAGGSGEIGTTYTAGGLGYVVEISTDLTVWRSGPSVVAWSHRREPLTGGMERVGIQVIDPVLNVSPQLWARIRITATD